MSHVKKLRLLKRSLIAAGGAAALALAGLAGAVAVPALTGANEHGTDHGPAASQGPITPELYAPSAQSTGGGVSSAEAVNDTASAMKGTGLTKAYLGPAPSSIQNTAPWLYLDFNGDLSQPGSDMLYSWYGALIQGAISEEMRTSEKTTNDVIGGSDVTVTNPDGSSVDLGGGAGNVAAGQNFSTDNWTAGSAEEQADEIRVKSVLTKFDLTPSSVTYTHALGTAISVVATYSGTLPATWTNDQLRAAIGGQNEGEPSQYEGLYIEIDRPAGKPLFISSAAYRTGAGGLWFAPGTDIPGKEPPFGALHGSLPPDAASR